MIPKSQKQNDRMLSLGYALAQEVKRRADGDGN
jgi:hypothetical protein